MKKIITIIITILFLCSFYIIPSAEAITLGEIKSESSTGEKNNDSIKADKDLPLKKEDAVSKKKNDVPVKENRVLKNEVNPRLVCLLSVILPGGGHFYMNNDAKGMSFCLAAGAGYTLTGFFMVKTMLADRGSVAYKNYLLLTGFLFFITLVIHFVGIIEAYSDADEVNKKNLFESGRSDPFQGKVIIEN